MIPKNSKTNKVIAINVVPNKYVNVKLPDPSVMW